MADFIHCSEDQIGMWDRLDNEATRILREETVEYQGNEVLAVQQEGKYGLQVPLPYVTVPGIVTKAAYRHVGDYKPLPVSRVRKIRLKKDQQNIATLVRQAGFKGPIEFW